MKADNQLCPRYNCWRIVLSFGTNSGGDPFGRTARCNVHFQNPKSKIQNPKCTATPNMVVRQAGFVPKLLFITLDMTVKHAHSFVPMQNIETKKLKLTSHA